MGAPTQCDPEAMNPDAISPDAMGGPPKIPHYGLLSVVVPVFNERNTVAEIIRRIRAVELPVRLEVVVVDDGSSDGSDKSSVRFRTRRYV